MFETLKILLEFEEYVPPSISVNNGTNSSNNILQPASTNIFGNERAASGMGGTGELTATSVGNYLDKAAQINDGVECVGFAIELDDGDMVKVYVDKSHAVDFETAISNAMGGDASFEDILLQVANDYDVVDVVWPNNQYGTNPDAGSQPADVAPNTTPQPPVEPAATPATEPAPENADGDDLDDPTELKGSISQKTTPAPKLDAESSTEPTDDTTSDDEGNTPTDGDTGGESTSDSSDATEVGGDKSTDSASTEQSAPVEGEETADTEQSSGQPESTDGEEGSGDDSKESTPSSDDGISVTIHRKKKSKPDSGEPSTDAPFKESLEEAPTTSVPKRASDMFKALNLSSHFSAAGSQAQNLIGKRILVIIGYIGIPGEALSKVPNFMDSINAAAVSINNNAGAKTAFNQVYHIITSTPKQDKFADTQYREDFKAFLKSIGFDTTSIGERADVIHAILFGAHCINAAPPNKIKFRTFADKINAKSE